MDKYVEKLENCVEYVRTVTDFVPSVAIVLGSGLNNYADQVEKVCEISYRDIPGFPVSTAPGHDGRFIFGWIRKVPVVVMKGRIHYYEGYEISDVVLPVRLMRCLGAGVLLLTNAAGGVNKDFHVGNFMVIRDQITCFVPSPLRDGDWSAYGSVFPDMSDVYDSELAGKILAAAGRAGYVLQQGVYLQASGPAFETKAEIRAFRTMGADAVGMSTAVEATAAHQMGMRVCGLSCITNMACGVTDRPITGAEVNETAERVAADFTALVSLITEAVGK
ncbi:MAG: purine-nucleoside phosphorylase [Lachnospiraceae bacterium]|nr:purine-nucleoside phosphorylase [Lachnospiraceae bacterium]